MIQSLREMVANARAQIEAGGYKNFEEYAQSPEFQEYYRSLLDRLAT
jgi:hypothetical protein